MIEEDEVVKRPPIEKFGTTHMPLIAFLKYNDYIVQKMEKVGPGKTKFWFENVDRDLLADFNMDRTLVEPNEFSRVMAHQSRSAKRTAKL